jgi:cytochrome P450
MRYRPIGFAVPRVATGYLELAVVCIPAGTIVFAKMAAANRDPAALSDPDRVDITGDNMVGTLSFGNGAHYWLGSYLARLVLAQALTVMAQRMPNLRRTGPAPWPYRGHPTHPLCPSNSTPDTERANQPRAE